MKLVFVSSTFKDMQFERDALNSHVVPQIDSFLTSFGEELFLYDLRWGVDTTSMSEEESSKKVLNICLDAIDDSRPYMIVLIGERYGWIPEEELLRENAKCRGIPLPDKQTSVTNLEIEYGALLNPDYEGRVLFYFRDLDTSSMSEEEKKTYQAESPLHQEKIAALKAKILKQYPQYVREYHAKWDEKSHQVVELDALMDTIRDDLHHILEKDLLKEQSIPWQERIIQASQAYLQRLLKYHAPVDLTLERTNRAYNLYDDLDYDGDHEYGFLVITGKDGSGKSHALADLYRLNGEEGFCYVFGVNDQAYDEYNFLKTFIYYLETHLQKRHKSFPPLGDDLEKYHSYLTKLIQQINPEEEMVNVYIDNASRYLLNLLYNLEYGLNPHLDFAYLAQMGIRFHIVFNESALPLPDDLPFFDQVRYINMGEAQIDKSELVKQILASHHKQLSEEVVEYLLQKEASSSPLYLSLSIARLLLLDHDDYQAIRQGGDGIKAINQYMKSLVDKMSEQTEALALEIIHEVAERTEYDFTYQFLGALAFSHLGLNALDFERFFLYAGYSFSSYKYSLAYHNLKPLLVEEGLNHYLRFRNEEIAEAVRRYLLDHHFAYVGEDMLEYERENEDIEFHRNSLMTALLLEDEASAIKIYHEKMLNQSPDSTKALAFMQASSKTILSFAKHRQWEILFSFLLSYLDKYPSSQVNFFCAFPTTFEDEKDTVAIAEFEARLCEKMEARLAQTPDNSALLCSFLEIYEKYMSFYIINKHVHKSFHVYLDNLEKLVVGKNLSQYGYYLYQRIFLHDVNSAYLYPDEKQRAFERSFHDDYEKHVLIREDDLPHALNHQYMNTIFAGRIYLELADYFISTGGNQPLIEGYLTEAIKRLSLDNLMDQKEQPFLSDDDYLELLRLDLLLAHYYVEEDFTDDLFSDLFSVKISLTHPSALLSRYEAEIFLYVTEKDLYDENYHFLLEEPDLYDEVLDVREEQYRQMINRLCVPTHQFPYLYASSLLDYFSSYLTYDLFLYGYEGIEEEDLRKALVFAQASLEVGDYDLDILTQFFPTLFTLARMCQKVKKASCTAQLDKILFDMCRINSSYLAKVFLTLLKMKKDQKSLAEARANFALSEENHELGEESDDTYSLILAYFDEVKNS